MKTEATKIEDFSSARELLEIMEAVRGGATFVISVRIPHNDPSSRTFVATLGDGYRSARSERTSIDTTVIQLVEQWRRTKP